MEKGKGTIYKKKKGASENLQLGGIKCNRKERNRKLYSEYFYSNRSVLSYRPSPPDYRAP